MHNGKYLTFTGSNGSYTYKGENNTGTELKLNKATYNFIANELPAREEYTVYEVSGTTGYSFSIDPVTFTITPAGSVKKVFTNKAMTGTISIVKHSADGVLSGWQFRVTGTAKTGQSYDKTFTTDAKGTITISNIRIGDYKVTEVKTGKTVGYITENSKDLEVKTDTVTTVNIENKPYANIVINKVDSVKGTALSGATFGIYTDAECEIPAQAYTSATDDTLTDAEITESATGKYTCNYLPISSATGTTYYVKELTAPEHYAIDTDVHPVTLKTANSTVAVSNNATSKFYETPLGSVRTTKVDADHPDVLLSGAEFTVYQSDKATVYGSLTETSKGTYQLDEIPAGTYYLKETKAPKYYNIDNTFYQFTISDAGKVVDVSINGNDKFPNAPQKGSIKIVKRSADGVLSGWQFRVTGTAKTGQSYDQTFTTNAKGTITISNLRIGDYKVIEVKTGKTVGYITPANQTIEVKSNATTTATFENKPFGHIVINKVDAKTGEKVTGATFGIYTDSTCKTVAKAYKSNTDSTLVNAEIIETATGVYTCNNLPISSATGTTYYVKELTAPEGYYLDTDVHPVTLKTANATVSVSNEIGKSDFNEYPYGHAQLTKEWILDNGTNDLTADELVAYKAQLENSLYFTIKDSSGNYITATGSNGVYKYTSQSATEYRYTLKNGTFNVAELPTGTYTVEEHSSLSDYTIKSANPVTITVVRNQTAQAKFINERDKGTAQISKSWVHPETLTSAQIAQLESNVKFTVKNANGEYLKASAAINGKYTYKGVQTTESYFVLNNSKFEIVELPTGTYTITEYNNAVGYLPLTQSRTITVTKGKTATAAFVNEVILGNVTLTKVDEDYPEIKLTGAVFTVYKSDKKTVVGTMKETETGVYSLEGLVYGEYYVQETKAPEYFVRDVNFYYFQIVNDGETVEVSNDELGKGTFINSPAKGEIKIVKTSYDNKVEGIHFEVTGKTYTGQTFKKTYTTDKNGIIRINDLRAGEYTIHEVKDSASAGYLLPADKQLTIDRDGVMAVANMHNSKLPDNPPTGASEDSFTQTAVIIISMVMMSAAVVLVFPLSKRKRKR